MPSRRKSGSGSILKLIIIVACLAAVAGIGLFAYKAIDIDHEGKYATTRLAYTKDYGMCMLITYKPDHQITESKGFAITNIPVTDLFSKRIRANFSDSGIADSEETLMSYKLLSALTDNKFVDTLFKLLSSESKGSQSKDVGDNGRYFIIPASDLGKEQPYY